MLGVLVVLLGAGAAVRAAAAKPDFAIGSQPTSQSTQQGQSAAYALTLTGSNGFGGKVALSASGLPAGATASFAPATVTLTTSTTTASSTLTVATSSSMAVGTYSFTVTAASGNTKKTVSLSLTVNKTLNGSFTLSATPATVSVSPGSVAVYTVAISRTSTTSAVTLSLSGSLPSGSSGSFSPNPVTGNSSTLQVSTGSATPDGSYTLYIVGAVNGTYQYAQATLVVDSKLSAKPFSISGGPTGTLAPGVAPRSIDLVVNNPGNQPLSVTNLSVVVTGTNKTGCSASDFAVTQFSAAYPLTVPKNSSASLSQLGISPANMPKVQMLDLARNQDACKNATVSLSYSGSGTGN